MPHLLIDVENHSLKRCTPLDMQVIGIIQTLQSQTKKSAVPISISAVSIVATLSTFPSRNTVLLQSPQALNPTMSNVNNLSLF